MANVAKPCNAYAGGEAMRWAKSRYVTSADGSNSYLVIPVPKKALVTRVLLDTKTGFTAASTGRVSIGFTGNGEVQSDTFFMPAKLITAVGIIEANTVTAATTVTTTAVTTVPIDGTGLVTGAATTTCDSDAETVISASGAVSKYFETSGGSIVIALTKGNSAADYVGRVFVEYTVVY